MQSKSRKLQCDSAQPDPTRVVAHFCILIAGQQRLCCQSVTDFGGFSATFGFSGTTRFPRRRRLIRKLANWLGCVVWHQYLFYLLSLGPKIHRQPSHPVARPTLTAEKDLLRPSVAGTKTQKLHAYNEVTNSCVCIYKLRKKYDTTSEILAGAIKNIYE